VGLVQLDIQDVSIMAEDQEQGVLVDAVGKIADVDGVGNNVRKDGVVRGESRLALLYLGEGEGEGLVIAKGLSLMVSEVDQDGQIRKSRWHTFRATWQCWKNSNLRKTPAGKL
jgi:hypothetical protein